MAKTVYPLPPQGHMPSPQTPGGGAMGDSDAAKSPKYPLDKALNGCPAEALDTGYCNRESIKGDTKSDPMEPA